VGDRWARSPASFSGAKVFNVIMARKHMDDPHFGAKREPSRAGGARSAAPSREAAPLPIHREERVEQARRRRWGGDHAPSSSNLPKHAGRNDVVERAGRRRRRGRGPGRGGDAGAHRPGPNGGRHPDQERDQGQAHDGAEGADAAEAAQGNGAGHLPLPAQGLRRAAGRVSGYQDGTRGVRTASLADRLSADADAVDRGDLVPGEGTTVAPIPV